MIHDRPFEGKERGPPLIIRRGRILAGDSKKVVCVRKKKKAKDIYRTDSICPDDRHARLNGRQRIRLNERCPLSARRLN